MINYSQIKNVNAINWRTCFKITQKILNTFDIDLKNFTKLINRHCRDGKYNINDRKLIS